EPELLNACLDALEIDLRVRPANALEALHHFRVRESQALHRVEAKAPMRKFGMNRIDGVFLTLQPIARDNSRADLAEHALFDEQIPARQQRRGLRSQIGPDQAAEFLHRIGRKLDAVFKMSGAFGRLLDALTRGVIHPTMIGTA